jgi:hypothetical protein
MRKIIATAGILATLFAGAAATAAAVAPAASASVHAQQAQDAPGTHFWD